MNYLSKISNQQQNQIFLFFKTEPISLYQLFIAQMA
jgi:hypothetical protein